MASTDDAARWHVARKRRPARAGRLGFRGRQGPAFTWCASLALWAAGLAGTLVLVLAEIDDLAEILLVGCILAVLSVLRGRDQRGVMRLFQMSCLLFLTLRYLVWRTTHTIGFHDPAAFAAALLLYVAEL
jgi:hypothetical protein